MQTAAIESPRGGRPALPPNRKRTEVVSFRLTPDEMDSAYQYAMKHGEPLNVVLRQILLRLVKRR